MSTQWRPDNDDEDDEWSEDFSDSEPLGDDESDDSTITVECPMCGCEAYEDTEQCPLCGEWLIRRTTVWTNRPMWFVLLGMAGIVAVILNLLFVF